MKNIHQTNKTTKYYNDPFEYSVYSDDHFWDTPTWPQIIGVSILIVMGIVGVMTLT